MVILNYQALIPYLMGYIARHSHPVRMYGILSPVNLKITSLFPFVKGEVIIISTWHCIFTKDPVHLLIVLQIIPMENVNYQKSSNILQNQRIIYYLYPLSIKENMVHLPFISFYLLLLLLITIVLHL